MRHSIFLMNPICMEVLCRPHRQGRKRAERPYRSSQSHGIASRGNSKCVC